MQLPHARAIRLKILRLASTRRALATSLTEMRKHAYVQKSPHPRRIFGREGLRGGIPGDPEATNTGALKVGG